MSDRNKYSVPDIRAAITPTTKKYGRIIILTADRVEDIEFFYPYYRFTEEGYHVDVVTPKGDKLTAYNGMELQHTKSIDEVNPDDYDLLYIPGGFAPLELRYNEKVLDFVQKFSVRGGLIGAICHGPQLLVEAGLLKGRNATSWKEVASEIIAAGGTYIDEPTVEDGQFITARKPGDLPVHLSSLFKRLREVGELENER